MKKSAYILKKIPVLMTVVVILGSTFGINAQDNPDNLKRIKQEMVAPPFLPEFDQVGPKELVVVEIELTIEEKKLEIAPGVFIWAMTFDGSVPGPMIVVHENDYVELTLINPESNSLQHNIDFHAATGAMGGGDLTVVNPGEEVTMRFKATKSGTFVYHCAPGGMMVPLHVVSGMNGVIMVLPREGLTDNLGEPVTFDKAFYVVEQDYYIPSDEGGDYKEYDFPSEGFGDMMEVFRSLTPSHIVFNGVEGALTGENALRAEVGDKVLFVSAQANRDTRMHLIGGHADLVWNGGSFGDKPSTNYETWAIPGGAAVPMLYEFKQPGIYAYVNHNLIEAMSFGAVGIVEVEGEWNDDLMKQISEPKKIEKKK